MPKVFCLLCIHFKPRNWCLGWCDKKMIYIHKPLRNCAKSYITEHALKNPADVLAWYNRSAEWGKIRYEMLKQYYNQKEMNQ